MGNNKHVNKKEFRKVEDTESRLEFLAKKFKIFDIEDGEEMLLENKRDLEIDPTGIKLIGEYSGNRNNILLYIIKHTPGTENKMGYIDYLISSDVFTNIIIADPTENKSNVQWMLQTFLNLIKTDKREAIRFVTEDLGMANTYLELFEANKRKKRFKEMAIKNEKRKWLLANRGKTEDDWEKVGYNPSDITQYKSLSQLFDSVDPFRERSHSDLEDAMNRFVHIGEADIDYRDRFWTVFVPKTKEANCVMENFGNWCTAQPNQGMFASYVENERQPNGEPSKIYVIINNDLFEGKSVETYQIHFESKQIKDRTNGSNVDLYDLIFDKPHGEGIHEYFHAELDRMARESKQPITENLYIDYLIKFGFTDSLFDYLDSDVLTINFNGNKTIPKLPDLSRFTNVDQLLIMNVGLREIHPSVYNLSNLEYLSFHNNKLTSIPSGIGKLKKLRLLNIKGNQITDIPEDISELDNTRGGNLYRVSVDMENVGEETIKKLKKLLPTTIIGI